ncbi:basic proline-rich protein-like [Penaeus monodon]|uniref:basic proline-rich protein-like n=1 Tax=Penaeus monodon TaxID=6687 RepID=UPI0018A7712A|nr:basic proline-rich protein-like [Penaeus monodon]
MDAARSVTPLRRQSLTVPTLQAAPSGPLKIGKFSYQTKKNPSPAQRAPPNRTPQPAGGFGWAPQAPPHTSLLTSPPDSSCPGGKVSRSAKTPLQANPGKQGHLFPRAPSPLPSKVDTAFSAWGSKGAQNSPGSLSAPPHITGPCPRAPTPNTSLHGPLLSSTMPRTPHSLWGEREKSHRGPNIRPPRLLTPGPLQADGFPFLSPPPAGGFRRFPSGTRERGRGGFGPPSPLPGFFPRTILALGMHSDGTIPPQSLTHCGRSNPSG